MSENLKTGKDNSLDDIFGTMPDKTREWTPPKKMKLSVKAIIFFLVIYVLFSLLQTTWTIITWIF